MFSKKGVLGNFVHIWKFGTPHLVAALNKAHGHDNIYVKIIEICGLSVIKALHLLCNICEIGCGKEIAILATTFFEISGP